jgi:hypothetical protein
MPPSKAYVEFTQSLAVAQELLRIERGYPNPPRVADLNAVQGLRGAVAVLVVASFERFLKDSVEEHVAFWVTHPSVALNRLPDIVRICSVFNTLDRALKGPPHQKTRKIDRLIEIEAACRQVLSNVANPAAFAELRSNPNSEQVKTLLGNLDLSDVFNGMKVRFERKWGKPVAHTFIADKLDEIVSRRHVVAHTAYALGITRGQLRESIRFLRILAELIDSTIKRQVATLR